MYLIEIEIILSFLLSLCKLCYSIPESDLLGDFDMALCFRRKWGKAKARAKSVFYVLCYENAKLLAFLPLCHIHGTKSWYMWRF